MLYSVELRSHFSDGKDRNLLYSFKRDHKKKLIIMPKFTTYILYSKRLDSFYIGYSGDVISKRLTKHHSEHKGYTARAKDWDIAFTENLTLKKKLFFMKRSLNPGKVNYVSNNLLSGAKLNSTSRCLFIKHVSMVLFLLIFHV